MDADKRIRAELVSFLYRHEEWIHIDFNQRWKHTTTDKNRRERGSEGVWREAWMRLDGGQLLEIIRDVQRETEELDEHLLPVRDI